MTQSFHEDQYIETEDKSCYQPTVFINDVERVKCRPEVHTRSAFAYAEAERLFKKMIYNTQQFGGNILSCQVTKKFSQARRIYVHYVNEYQKCQKLPLLK